ncbi:PEP-utilizing enzyme [Planctomycetota bacterium]
MSKKGVPLLSWRVLVFRHLLRAAERFAPYRENMRFHVLRVYEHARLLLQEMGRRLARQGVVERPDDVFFLEFGEVERALVRGDGGDLEGAPRLRAAARDRKRSHEEALSFDPPKFVHDDGTPAPRPLVLHSAGLQSPYLEGVGVSGGVVTGLVRRAETLDDALSCKPDEILLAKAATPAWTPAFFLARGVILDIGGMLSHCAVIAREYGIPCVVGVRSGMELLRDGDRVTLDAHTGRVYITKH